MPVPQFPTGKFELSSESANYVFSPSIYPADVTVSKARNKVRHDNLCEGETVSDTGSKNREILVNGFVLRSELPSFDHLLDQRDNFDLLSDEWVGEVQIVDGEYVPYGVDVFRFKLSLLSTGRDEYERPVSDGIISTGVSGIDASRAADEAAVAALKEDLERLGKYP